MVKSNVASFLAQYKTFLLLEVLLSVVLPGESHWLHSALLMLRLFLKDVRVLLLPLVRLFEIMILIFLSTLKSQSVIQAAALLALP